MSIARRIKHSASLALRRAGLDPALVARRVRPIDEATADWYDDVYASESGPYVHGYEASPYLPVWETIGRLLPVGSKILEIGCGPGQLAELLFDRGIPAHYLGFDISAVAIEAARARVPAYRFEVADAFSTTLLDDDYDVVICTEVLEHVVNDRELLGRIRPGALVLASVPDFSSATHVRWFVTERQVRRRYAPCLDGLEVIPCTSERGWTIFVLHGRAR